MHSHDLEDGQPDATLCAELMEGDKFVGHQAPTDAGAMGGADDAARMVTPPIFRGLST